MNYNLDFLQNFDGKTCLLVRLIDLLSQWRISFKSSILFLSFCVLSVVGYDSDSIGLNP